MQSECTGRNERLRTVPLIVQMIRLVEKLWLVNQKKVTATIGAFYYFLAITIG